LPRLPAIIPGDVATYYGADLLAGVILTGGLPYRGMLPEIENPTNTAIVPVLLSDDLAEFTAVCPPTAPWRLRP
jgi:hypothetical protein